MWGGKRWRLLVIFVILCSWWELCVGKKVHLSAEISSAMCGQLELYKETKTIQPSLKNLPADIPILRCIEWEWNRCEPGETDCDYVTVHKSTQALKCLNMRVIGGQEARPDEFPWDVSIRFIYDWGSFFPEPRNTESIAKNDFAGLKESHRCTGTLYSPDFVITSAWCGLRGKDYMVTKNRFVAWIARGPFVDAKMVEFLPGQKKKGDIFIHPDFNPDVNTDHTKDHDVALIKMPKPFKFTNQVYALEVAPPGKEFKGTAVFTGWGTTIRELIETQLGRPGSRPGFGTKLFKLELLLVPFAGTCENITRKYLSTQAGYDPKEDLSKRYLCAKADKPEAQGACGGDLGGPLICDDGGKKYLCGIRNSWAILANCPSEDNLEIFIRPSWYYSWFQETAGPQKASDMGPPPPPKKG